MPSSSHRSNNMASKNGSMNSNAMGTTNGETAPMVSVAASALKGNRKSSLPFKQRPQSHNANIKLIEEVRRRPLLYDTKHINYAKKPFIEKCWNQIGKICNEPGSVCKKRWRNIRAAFARSMDIYKTQSGPNRVKPYYLHQQLKFLIDPMIKKHTSNSNFDHSSTEKKIYMDDHDDDQNDGESNKALLVDEVDSDEASAPPDDTETNENVIHNETPTDAFSGARRTTEGWRNSTTIEENITSNNGHDDTVNPTSANAFETPRRASTAVNDESSKESTKGIKKNYFENMQNECDLLFVQSLYHDMQDLSTSKKLHLKRCIYECLEKVTMPNSPRQPTSAFERLCLNLRNLNEPQLHQINCHIKNLLSPTALNAGSSSSHLMLNIASANIRDNSRSSELSPPNPIIIKEELLNCQDVDFNQASHETH